MFLNVLYYAPKSIFEQNTPFLQDHKNFKTVTVQCNAIMFIIYK